MKNSIDRRVRKTKNVLRHNLTLLLSQNDLKNITVKELCEICDINRGTFYLHYKDIYDLFEQIEDEILYEFIGIINKYKYQKEMSWKSVLLDLLKYISANADIFKALLRTSESVLLTRIIDISKPKSKKEWILLLGDEKEQYYDYYYAFITEGCIAVVKAWVLDGMKETPEDMASLIGRMMTNSIN
ncbi:MAG: hypothetical protein CVU97_03095 [Firmicutes bacterium HGW-Firmicutes-21]|nr:MAG: hypothetical protein CVU97_03095 [Firmicutes bacterium HGW-Firmicutes-21]